jgi:hypothetical protein
MKSFIITIALFSISLSVSAQSDRFIFGFFPEASLSYKISEKYAVTHKIESQHGMFDSNRLNEELKYEHSLTDLQSFIGRRLSPFVKVDLGYQYRLEEGENTHRSIQQVSILQRESYYRIGHRIRTDQTFFKDEAFLFRMRYRIKGQVPLQGQELDPGENYLTVSNEVIYMTQSGEDDIENRLTTALGFYIDDKNKFEMGFDYRTDDYLVENKFRHRLWLKFGYYKRL